MEQNFGEPIHHHSDGSKSLGRRQISDKAHLGTRFCRDGQWMEETGWLELPANSIRKQYIS